MCDRAAAYIWLFPTHCWAFIKWHDPDAIWTCSVETISIVDHNDPQKHVSIQKHQSEYLYHFANLKKCIIGAPSNPFID